MPERTPSQTIGPFFHNALPFRGGDRLVVGAASEQAVVIEGAVLDGAGEPILDALIETWQADAAGRYRHADDDREAPAVDPSFDGFGRVATTGGRFSIETIKPGRVPGPGGRLQAPHVLVGILARGLLTRLITRIYFDDEPANAEDPILDLIPEGRRPTLMARRLAEARYRFDVVLQGEGETVFFDA